MTLETVQFVSAKPYLNVPDSVFNSLFWCAKGRSEIVVLCSDELKAKLQALPSEHLIPRFKDIVKYLQDNNINYTENYSSTTKL